MKALKRMGSLMFTVTLCFALIVGCSSNSTGTGNNNSEGSKSTTTPSSNQDSNKNESKERVKLRVEVFDRGNAPEGLTVTNNLMTEYVQKNFGDPNNIDIEYVAIPRSEEINSLNVQMAAGTAPDLIFTYNEGARSEERRVGKQCRSCSKAYD